MGLSRVAVPRACWRWVFPTSPGGTNSVALVSWGAALVGKDARTQPCSPKSPALQEWPKHWRAQLKKSPGDLSLVTSLVSHLLRYQGLLPPYLLVGPDIRQTKGSERKGTEEEIGGGCTGHPQAPSEGLGLQTSHPAALMVFEQLPSTFSEGWVRLYLPHSLIRKLQESLL